MSTETVPTKRSGGISDLKKMFGGGTSSLRQFGILASLIAIILIFQIWTAARRSLRRTSSTSSASSPTS
jgi:putative multiple sugar transport system permease protein